MGLESATFISQLNASNPVGGDAEGQGDDHLRLIKAALQATFPNANRAFYLPNIPTVQVVSFAVTAVQASTTFLVNTTSGAVTITLPTLAAADAGWECSFIKINLNTTPMFIAPPAGTIQSGEIAGLAKTRRCIPGRRTRVIWTGTAFFAERVDNSPIGTVMYNWLPALPIGYEAADGSSLSSAANYPDYNAAKGSLILPNVTGRVMAGKEVVASRLTAAVSGVDGATMGAVGGSQSFTLSTANMPVHTHGPGNLSGFTSTNGNHNHDYTDSSDNSAQASAGTARNVGTTTDSTSTDGNHSHDVTVDSGFTASSGLGTAKGAVPPMIVLPVLVVVE